MKYYTRKKLTYEYINSINTLWGGNKLPGFTDGLLQAQERGDVQLLTLADIFE